MIDQEKIDEAAKNYAKVTIHYSHSTETTSIPLRELSFKDGVAWRDANPNPKRSIEVQMKPIIDNVLEPWKEKIAELVKDHQRLEWVIKNNVIVHMRGGKFNLVSHGIPLRLYESFYSWRDAVDDGMKVQP